MRSKKISPQIIKPAGAVVTGDLIKVATSSSKNKQVYTEEFIDAIANKLKKKL